MKNYTDFKRMVNWLIYELGKDGLQIIPKKWAKISPYQKRRYKPEYQYPEVWLYRNDSNLGAVFTGEDIESLYLDRGLEGVKQYIEDCLF